jgi:muramidase (phage lysozyme)
MKQLTAWLTLFGLVLFPQTAFASVGFIPHSALINTTSSMEAYLYQSEIIAFNALQKPRTNPTETTRSSREIPARHTASSRPQTREDSGSLARSGEVETRAGGSTLRSRPVPSTERPYTQQEVIELIHHWADYFGVPVEHPLRIARCESGLNTFAMNRTSSASGVFQFLSGTWANTYEGKAGLSVFDSDANIRAAIRHMSVHGYAAWECK